MDTLVIFYTVQHAYRAEKLCCEQKITCRLIAVPLNLSHSCNGLALKLAKSDLETVVSLLHRNKVKFSVKE